MFPILIAAFFLFLSVAGIIPIETARAGLNSNHVELRASRPLPVPAKTIPARASQQRGSSARSSKQVVNEDQILSAGPQWSAGDNFGSCVALSDQTALISSTYDDNNKGSVCFFIKDPNGHWSSGVRTVHDDAGDGFGSSISLSGNTAIIGASGKFNDGYVRAGKAYVFSQDAEGNWSNTDTLEAADPFTEDYFGFSVAIDGNIAVVSAHYDDDMGENSGSVYVFSKNADGNWLQEAKLVAEDGEVNDYFGRALSISEETIIVGSPMNNKNGTSGEFTSGAVYVFSKDAQGSWIQTDKLVPSSPVNRFGYTLSVSGNTLIVGHAASTAPVVVFYKDSNNHWSESNQKIFPAEPYAGNYFGKSVALSGNRALIGAAYDDTLVENSGAAFVFSQKPDGTWEQLCKLKNTVAATGQRFGAAVAIKGEDILAGAPQNSLHGSNSGAAYAFHLLNTSSQQEISLHSGINFISLNVLPADPSPQAVFGELVTAGRISSVTSLETAKQFRKLGPNWVNGIGDLVPLGCYKVNVTGTDPIQLLLEGQLAADPAVKNLKTGVNLIGFAQTRPAYATVQALLETGSIDQIIELETNDKIELVNDVWVDNIGMFEKGRVYKVMVNDPAGASLNIVN